MTGQTHTFLIYLIINELRFYVFEAINFRES